ncbi:hypothetical protein IEN85_04170 [Pelagicoccus sp. NFK12]|uniref:Flagellar motility protein MotE, a chaperone for MotC folding n=1 Tax=Pelagicoccus enzymogenes TaxID=2773457 RepID=A0A927F5B0_9BACT|nr:hypothetical protein [Pelagicoccus enzymogenes]MBD5778674.1 hypothetical protein [Pelagicoccus enzymogenes]
MLSKPLVIALIALVLMVGTQFVALKMYWSELFPEPEASAVVIKREEPKPFEWGFASEYITQLERELHERIMMLDAREEELNAYEARLGADRAEIEEIKTQVERMREHLLEGVVKLESDEVENLKRLAKVYATLTPDATVNIFRDLDDSTVVKILFFMKSDTVGAVLQEMATANGGIAEQVRRAAKISDMLRLFSDNTKDNLAQN